jgi:hypothetical protein
MLLRNTARARKCLLADTLLISKTPPNYPFVEWLFLFLRGKLLIIDNTTQINMKYHVIPVKKRVIKGKECGVK